MITKNERTRKAIWFDFDLNVKKSLIYDPNLNFRFDGYDFYFLVNSKNNIICNTDKFTIELDKEGNKIKSSKKRRLVEQFFFEDTHNDKYFSVSGTSVKLVDMDLNPATTMIQIPSLITQRAIVFDQHSSRITAGFNKQYFLLNTLTSCQGGYIERILKYDTKTPNYSVDVLFENTIIDCGKNLRPGFFGVDMFYEDYIYNTNVLGWCRFIPPPDYDPWACSSSYNIIRCIDKNGALRWSKILGGDAAYHPFGVVATRDTGCVVLVNRYKPEVNTQYEGDLYYLKFDKHGNVQDPLPVNVPINKPIEATINLYPNPVKDKLNIKSNTHSIKNFCIEIYNVEGQLVLQQKVNNQAVVLAHLPAGVYACRVKTANKIVYISKLLKF